MSKVAIVTDSTAYLPPEVIDQYNIHVVPLQLIWGEETFKDGVDIQPEEFYARLRTAEIMPTTSQPSAAAFEAVFKDLHESGAEILAALISSGISGTVASAEQAREMLPEARIEIVDTLATATELGFLLLEAAQAAEAGADLTTCKALIKNLKERSGILFAVDTLEFLHRGGRIGGGKRFLGTILNIKPLLEMRDGRIDALEQVRTRSKAHARLVELLEERAQGRRYRYVSAMHADAEEDAAVLLRQAEERLDIDKSFISVIGPVLGTHAGPGTLALAYMLEGNC